MSYLWIWTSIGGAIIGAIVLKYIESTIVYDKAYSKFDLTIDYIRDNFGIDWLNQPDDMWRKRYPRITSKIDELEKRIKELEDGNVG